MFFEIITLINQTQYTLVLHKSWAGSLHADTFTVRNSFKEEVGQWLPFSHESFWCYNAGWWKIEIKVYAAGGNQEKRKDKRKGRER